MLVDVYAFGYGNQPKQVLHRDSHNQSALSRIVSPYERVSHMNFLSYLQLNIHEGKCLLAALK